MLWKSHCRFTEKKNLDNIWENILWTNEKKRGRCRTSYRLSNMVVVVCWSGVSLGLRRLALIGGTMKSTQQQNLLMENNCSSFCDPKFKST